MRVVTPYRSFLQTPVATQVEEEKFSRPSYVSFLFQLKLCFYFAVIPCELLLSAKADATKDVNSRRKSNRVIRYFCSFHNQLN